MSVKKKISVIIPIYNEEKNIKPLYEKIKKAFEKSGFDFEAICIDDGSTDNSLEILIKINDKDNRLKIISLSRNFGKENAVKAGIDSCFADAAIFIDADMQEPPELIPEMIEKWEKQGYESVYAKRKSRVTDGIIKRTTAYLFYRIYNKITKVNIPKDTGDFRLVDKKIINILKRMNEQDRFNKGLFSFVGFNQTFVEFERDERKKGKTKFGYQGLLNFALDGITSFSTLPLRMWSYVGLSVVFISLIMFFVFLFKGLLFGSLFSINEMILFFMFLFFGMAFVAVGIIGEYLGRVSNQIKNRPLYITKEKIGFND